METVLWIMQILLAGVFAASGLSKLAQPQTKLAESQAWATDFSDRQIKGIGILELLAAIGLIVPAALDIVPILTAFAATGLVLLMVVAARVHIRHGERQTLLVNLVLGGIALFIMIERFGPNSL